MADYFAIPDSALDPDAPVTSELAYALRDNPIAIAEGAAGAPRIADVALAGGVTGAGVSWVGNRYSQLGAGAVGSVIMARKVVTGVISFGGLIAGSSLRVTNVTASDVLGTPDGTWRCLGYAGAASGDAAATTIWLRVS